MFISRKLDHFVIDIAGVGEGVDNLEADGALGRVIFRTLEADAAEDALDTKQSQQIGVRGGELDGQIGGTVSEDGSEDRFSEHEVDTGDFEAILSGTALDDFQFVVRLRRADDGMDFTSVENQGIPIEETGVGVDDSELSFEHRLDVGGVAHDGTGDTGKRGVVGLIVLGDDAVVVDAGDDGTDADLLEERAVCSEAAGLAGLNNRIGLSEGRAHGDEGGVAPIKEIIDGRGDLNLGIVGEVAGCPIGEIDGCRSRVDDVEGNRNRDIMVSESVVGERDSRDGCGTQTEVRREKLSAFENFTVILGTTRPTWRCTDE